MIEYRKILAARIRGQLQYPASFAMDCITQMFTGAMEIATIYVLFSRIHDMGGFSLGEVALMYGLSGIAFSLADLAVGSVEALPDLVRTGMFDAILLRPLGALPQLLTADVSLKRLGRTAQAVAVLIYALAVNDVRWTAPHVLLVVITPIAGAAIFGAIFVAACSITFWVIESGEFANAFTYGGSTMTSYPLNIFSTWVRRLFTFVVPAAFVAYFPALGILGRHDPLGLPAVMQWCGPVAAVAAVVVAGMIWRVAVRHYTGTGS